MTVTKRLPALDALRAKLVAMGGRWKVVAERLPSTELAKLSWLQKAGVGDFLKVTPQLDAAAHRYLRSLKVWAPATNAREAMREAGEAIRAHIVLRFTAQGNDVPLRANKPDTVARKGHARVGEDSGDLLRALRAGRFRLEKIG